MEHYCVEPCLFCMVESIYVRIQHLDKANLALATENLQLKKENTLNAEQHFESAKYYFGFDWNERIVREYNRIYNEQKEKEPMEKTELNVKIASQLKECIENAIANTLDQYETDDHNNTYCDLLTRVQHFYETIEHEPIAGEKAEFICQLSDYMKELFADFIYIPED